MSPSHDNRERQRSAAGGMLPDPKYFLFDLKMLVGEGSPVWQDDLKFIDAFVQVKDHTLVSPFRLFPIYQFAQRANLLDGDFAQVGVYRGGSAKLITSVKTPDRAFRLFDTFEGLPPSDETIDYYKAGKFGDTSKDHVAQLLKDHKGIDITQGIFPSSARDEHRSASYAFVYLDVDIYKSNLDALSFFYPRLVPGGMIIIDDYGWTNTPGIMKSVHDFIDREAPRLSPIVTTKYQCLLIKDV